MKIAGYDIKPILLYLPDTPEWVARWEEGKKHFAEQGIEDILEVAGVHAQAFGIQGTRRYMRDAYARFKHNHNNTVPTVMPKEFMEQFYLGDGKTGGYISHYILYNVMKVLPDSHFLVLEDDARFLDGWRNHLEQALIDVPADFDFLFVGSACAMDKEPVHVRGDVYHFPYRPDKPDFFPQTGFAYIVAKKCIQTLIDTQRDCGDPVDVSLIYKAFPHLNVYAILPRLADQGEKTILPR